VSFTYGGAGSSPTSTVRFLIGDTNEASPLVTDEDIAYLLGEVQGNTRLAAIMACEGIIASLSRYCDQTVGSVSKSFSQMRDGYAATLANLRARAAYSGGRPFAGGISRVAERLAERNPDRIRPQFSTRMMNPRCGDTNVTGALGIETTDGDDYRGR
jgi:hypothetical protein